MAATIQQINKALGRYYEFQGATYNNYFEVFCDDNGLDDEGVSDDLNGEFADSIFPDDLDEDFPGIPSGKDDDERREYIFNLILKCWKNPDINFDVSLPDIPNAFENINPQSIEDIKNIYGNQCPAIFNQGMSTDGNLLSMLVIGKQHNFDYLLNLVDSYDRWRIKNPTNSLSPLQWGKLQENKHFQTLPFKGMKVKVVAAAKKEEKDKKEKQGKQAQPATTDYLQFATSCMSSFSGRCCSKLLLTNQFKINDSIQDAVSIINATIDFISNAVKKSNAVKDLGSVKAANVCPFQIDIILSTGKPKNDESKDETVDDDDEDDDDDDDGPAEEKVYFDYVGDIKKKLDNNKLKYSQTDKLNDGRAFGLFFDRFKQENKIKDDAYLRDKRFIALFDRRPKNEDKKEEDEKNIFLYEPPKGPYTRDIPKGAVPEWGISAARTCLLPPNTYNEDEAINKSTLNNQAQKPKDKDVTKDQNIGCGFHANGSILTISFHIRSAELMKAYLYFNGQIIRFMPEDIKTVLPILYNMDYDCGIDTGTNKDYIEKDPDLDGLIAEMSKKLVDKQFAAWLQEYPVDSKKE